MGNLNGFGWALVIVTVPMTAFFIYLVILSMLADHKRSKDPKAKRSSGHRREFPGSGRDGMDSTGGGFG